MSTYSNKDPNTAMVIEIVAGYLGLLGMGYLYAGRTAAGLLRLFGWWAFLALAVIGMTGLSLLPGLALLANPENAGGTISTGFGPVLCLLLIHSAPAGRARDLRVNAQAQHGLVKGSSPTR